MSATRALQYAVERLHTRVISSPAEHAFAVRNRAPDQGPRIRIDTNTAKEVFNRGVRSIPTYP